MEAASQDYEIKKEDQTMLMWIASLFASLFHCNAPTQMKQPQLDKPVAARAVPADQSILDLLVQLLSDGQHWP
jgi:hypothetical protein